MQNHVEVHVRTCLYVHNEVEFILYEARCSRACQAGLVLHPYLVALAAEDIGYGSDGRLETGKASIYLLIGTIIIIITYFVFTVH